MRIGRLDRPTWLSVSVALWRDVTRAVMIVAAL